MNALDTINVSAASLPQTYENAKNALAQCASIDECQDWADKAAALASYARQAKDDQLERMSQRIRARAIRRAGELLKQLDGRGDHRKSEGTHTSSITQNEAAMQAGMSKHQAVQAVRVASVPQDVFDTVIDEDQPATITQLADMGKKTQPKPFIDLQGRDPKEFNRSMHFVGMIEYYQRQIAGVDLEVILPGLDAQEAGQVRSAITKIDAIHDQIVTRI
ncbi:hypothetical protein F9K77_14295 [Ochrobactrum sp. LMG 5442]|nr:hypothetical protein F9K77_14295 [Ochrobactrum sp. LMG 5442]